MAQITIKTSKEHRFNKGVIIGGVEIKFDKYGMCEIPERYLEDVLNADESISLVDEEDVKKYAELTKESKKQKKEQAPIDVIEINDQMKIDNGKLTEANKLLKESNVNLTKELELSKAEVIRLNGVIEELQGKEITEEDIDGMEKAELLAFCEKSEFPKEEWENLKKVPKLKEYLKEKIKEVEDPIDGMGEEDLKAFCVECEFPTEEWEALEVEELKTYIKTKAKESQD
jgi:hypothetical protein